MVESTFDLTENDIKCFLRSNYNSNTHNLEVLLKQYKDDFSRDWIKDLYWGTHTNIIKEGFWPKYHGYVPVLTHTITRKALDKMLGYEKI